MVLNQFNIIELSTAVATIAAAAAALLAVTQKSRCKSFKCCCGLVDCQRDVPDIENQVEPNEDKSIEGDKDENTILNVAAEAVKALPLTVKLQK